MRRRPWLRGRFPRQIAAAPSRALPPASKRPAGGRARLFLPAIRRVALFRDFFRPQSLGLWAGETFLDGNLSDCRLARLFGATIYRIADSLDFFRPQSIGSQTRETFRGGNLSDCGAARLYHATIYQIAEWRGFIMSQSIGLRSGEALSCRNLSDCRVAKSLQAAIPSFLRGFWPGLPPSPWLRPFLGLPAQFDP